MLTFGSLFAGIGGFDLAFERCGFEPRWQVEIDPKKTEILCRYWPDVRRIDDIRNANDLESVDIVCGGDPCPVRSKAKGNRPSKSPDMSGYFLAVVGRLRPRWVVRENVPAPDAKCFAACLELLGYRVSALSFDSKYFTGQSRRRDYLCACLNAESAAYFQRAISIACKHHGYGSQISGKETPIVSCLTSRGNRMATEDTYCFEPGFGLRVLSPEEAESLQGFPRGYTAGFSKQCRRKMVGEAITVDVAEWIGKRIIEAELGDDSTRRGE